MGTQPLPKGAQPPIFGHVCCSQTAGWIKMPYATWYGGRPRPWPHCVRRGTSPHAPKRYSPTPNFSPMSVVAKRLD